MSDRRVHAKLASGAEIVRYDRAGHWYSEAPGGRIKLTIAEAVQLATLPDSEVTLGLSGGGRFDALVGRVLMERMTHA